MTRRLEQATEDALASGGRAAVEEAGFSEELKAELLARVASADAATATAAVAAAAGGAGAPPWAGEERTADAVLRMLSDAHKPLPPGLRGRGRPPPPPVVDMRIRRAPPPPPGRRAAAARERAEAYAGLSGAEREAVKSGLRERFSPAGAGMMPATVPGLAALANERIEDAIARGQFKNIPRGKGVGRDTRADNPFIDTTEYIMNNMIKRQEMVPPWIEKQQELVRAAEAFRARLRNDWRRHAARAIASRGGSLQEQMSRAAEYAEAEAVHNPLRGGAESRSSQPMLGRPFRDPAWEAAEQPYMELAVEKLNGLARSYNLMAPELAKKPYFSLKRELASCFADVAPQLADEIKQRAARPEKPPRSPVGNNPRGMLARLSNPGHAVRIYESSAPKYGLREMWRDFWSRPT